MDTTEDRIETPAGTVCLCFLSPDAILAVSGKDVGWLTLDGERRYANQRYVRDGDGTWSPSETHRGYANVVPDGSRVSTEPCPPDVATEAESLLRTTMTEWLLAHPERAAEADYIAATDALRRNAVHIASLRDGLAREIRQRAVLEERAAERKAALDHLTAGGTPSP